MTSRDWVKRKHSELYDQLKQATGFLSNEAARTRIGMGTETQQWNWYITTFTPDYNTYCEAYKDWENNALRNKEKTVGFKEAEKAIIGKFTLLYKGMLKDNPLVEDTDLIAMALPVRRKGRRREAEVADAPPSMAIDLTIIRQIRLKFSDASVEKRRGRPEWQRGVEIAWTVGDEPVIEMAKLTRSSFSTRSPYIFTFDDSYRTRYLSLAARWENTLGQKGPWSAVLYTVIP
jgi:hypothetical protein